jgi:Pyruvate/2-oxoacid:ferredoxin oxidoreductase delta subunit
MICYFSATGNCKYAAERIAAALGDRAMSIADAGRDISLSEGEIFGIVTPTYFWELPAPTREFLSKAVLPDAGKHYLFLTATYGTTPGCCGEDARLILKKRGYVLNASFSLKMPDSWTPFFNLSDPEKTARQNRKAEIEIAGIISRIQAGEKGNHTNCRIPYVFRFLTNPLLIAASRTKNFYAEDTCIGCGLCAEKCPVQAIEMQNGRPVWVKKRCALCLGCLHRCPKFAIQYGNGRTKLHGQYRNPNTQI